MKLTEAEAEAVANEFAEQFQRDIVPMYRSMHFMFADLGTLATFAACELVAVVAFGTHLNMGFAVGYLACSAVCNALAMRYRARKLRAQFARK